MDYFLNIVLAVGFPVLLYFLIAYANRRFRRIDRELERNAEAASLTTTELKALVQEAVTESLSALLARTERNEERLERMERLLPPPAPPPTEPRPEPGRALLDHDPSSEGTDSDEAQTGPRRLRGT